MCILLFKSTLADLDQWLLHLIADDEGAVVVMAAKILARLLVISGPAYMSKFVEKTGGITVMQHRLKRWWNIPVMWTICFAIFFGIDLAKIDFGRSFDLFNLLELFSSGDEVTVAYPEMLPVLKSMLQSGLMNVTRDQSDPDSPMTSPKLHDVATFSHGRKRSSTLKMNTIASRMNSPIREHSSITNIVQLPLSLRKISLLFRPRSYVQSQGF